MFVPTFDILGAIVPEKSLTQIPLCITLEWEIEKRKKGKKKSKEISALWFSFTQDTSIVCRCIQNFKTLALLVAEKSVMKSFIGENEKMTNKGNDKHKALWISRTRYKKLHPVFIRNFKIIGTVVPEKSLTKNFIREKEKWTSKGNDENKYSHSVLNNTTSHTQCLYQISKF